jgi:hypothetical protein
MLRLRRLESPPSDRHHSSDMNNVDNSSDCTSMDADSPAGMYAFTRIGKCALGGKGPLGALPSGHCFVFKTRWQGVLYLLDYAEKGNLLVPEYGRNSLSHAARRFHMTRLDSQRHILQWRQTMLCYLGAGDPQEAR